MSLTRINNKTGQPQVIPASDGRLTISVPIQIKRRSGRKVVTLPRPTDHGTTSRRHCKWPWPVVINGLQRWSPEL